MNYLFNSLEKLKEKLEDKYIFIFLDYDGTLTPIVDWPEKALVSTQVKELLKKLSNNSRLKVVLISGRSLADIKNKIGLRNIIYSGNHGLEIEGPKIKFEAPVSVRYKVILEHIKNDLNKRLCSIKGAFIEDKGLSLSLHYRLVDKKKIPQVKNIFHESTIIYFVRNKIKVKTGKMVIEVRPHYEWDKGKVVLWLLARQRFAIKGNPLVPIYIGDDKTDEDAFKVLKNKGVTIFVGKPKASYAQYYVKDTKEVEEFLKRILEIQRDRNLCRSK